MGRKAKGETPANPGPVIVLVRPQMGENIGMTARAMLNCGLGELRLVSPRDGWPDPRAQRAASGADVVLDGARVYDTVAEAVADLHHVVATTARDRELTRRVVGPRLAATEMRGWIGEGKRVGILFGAERTGLENDELVHADTSLTIPVNPAFSSLNLAQSVLLVAWEWSQAEDAAADEALVTGHSEPATRGQLDEFLDRLERELDETGFFKVEAKRPTMTLNIRALFGRIPLTAQEVRTLHGIVSELLDKRRRRPS